MLPAFPQGDWNKGHISKHSLTGHPAFSHHARNDLAGISHTWQHKRVNHLELTKVERLRQNIHVVTHLQFDGPLVTKFAVIPWGMP
jgi:hypothetical protein